MVVEEILRAPGNLRLSGAPMSVQATLVAQLVIQEEAPLIVICPNDELAELFTGDVRSSGPLLGFPPPPCSIFPSWDRSPYSPTHPSIRTRFARLSCLTDLITNKTPRIIVTTPAALIQKTIPPKLFEEHLSVLKANQIIESREALITKWIEAGYLKTDPVEDPGTFSVRGEILDIFPPQRDRPLRIELFDNQIEKIREFDPATQKTFASNTSSLTLALIPPAKEVLINQKTATQLRDKIKECADDLGISRAIRDPICASIAPGFYPDRSDHWVPFAYETPGLLTDYLPKNVSWVWLDPQSCDDAYAELRKEALQQQEKREARSLIVPEFSSLFSPWPMVPSSSARLRFERFEDDTKSTSQRLKIEFPAITASPTKSSDLSEAVSKLAAWQKEGFRICLFAATQTRIERLRALLEEHHLLSAINPPIGTKKVIGLYEGELSGGFLWVEKGLVVITDSEIFGRKSSAATRTSNSYKTESGSASKDWSGLSALSDLAVGDAIVHVDHGIGLYQGLVRLSLGGAPADFLLLEYANKDRLYLPVYRLGVIQKYVGAGENAPLDRLGSPQFEKTKEKVREAVQKLAIDLIQLYAERKIRPGIQFSPRDSLFREFESKFAFNETPDQSKSIDDILADLSSGTVMDRLICGDVGYGKTEVAMRAAFKAVSEGKQVAVLVPTTVLAFQHEQSFRQRFADYPIQIESLSRFKSPKQQKAILSSLSEGKVDIIIGTHRLLSKDIHFKDLGLIVVDEEHRFGVEHKEKLKTIRINTHVLTLTATPIPRTLHMALSGLREISLINTPPVDRLPIRTFVSKLDDEIIQRAIETELHRGGQVFVLHNRVQDIHKFAAHISELVPLAKTEVAHGQMGEGELEKAMLAFYEGKKNVLVCTSIIESGLDIPSANTILIDRADTLGLAQLYQIRGRVGRGQERAYAYLFMPKEGAVSADAKRRLEVIQRFVELGSGFSIANHDLEIRGGGDLLGPQQSGHIAAVGFELYTELLEEAIKNIRTQAASSSDQPSATNSKDPEIKIPFPAYLDESYIPDIHQRISLYRRFSVATSDEEVDRLEEELKDRFGTLPEPALNLLWLIRIKQLLKSAGVDGLTVGQEKVVLIPGTKSRLDPVRAIALVASDGQAFQLLPDSRFVATLRPATIRDLFFGLEGLIRRLLN